MYEFLDYRVEDAMCKEVVSVSPEASLAQVESIFEKRGFNGMPVLEPGGGIAGWVTKLDVLEAFRFTDDHMFPPYAEIMAQPVTVVMKRDLLSVTPRTQLTRVLEKLVVSRVKSFPVVDDDKIVGVIAREDVLQALRRAAAGERPPET